jgi:hypothetical protein
MRIGPFISLLHRSEGAPASAPPAPAPAPPQRAAAIIVAVTILAIVALSLWYLVRPQPLLVQGEADATRIDLAARVDGRVAEMPVGRGQNIAAAQTVVTIDNPDCQRLLVATLRRPSQGAMAHWALVATPPIVNDRPPSETARDYTNFIRSVPE